MLPAIYRLRASSDIRRVLQRGRYHRGQVVVIRHLPNPNTKRFCFIVSTKVSKKATVRNTIKRRAREAVSGALDDFMGGDYCIIALPGGTPPTQQQVLDDLKSFIQRWRRKPTGR